MKGILRILERTRRWPVVGRFSFGMMMGTALVWVLLRRRSETETLPEGTPVPARARRPAPSEIDITEAPVAEAEAEAEKAETSEGVAPADRLEVIRGIGPKFAERLRSAGIRTFNALAAETPEHLREIVRAQSWQKVEPEVWIAEARRLAER